MDQQPINQQTMAGRKPAAIERLLKAAGKLGASDVHMKVNAQPHMRIGGRVRTVKYEQLTPQSIDALIFEIMSEEQQRYYMEHGNLDFAHEMEDGDRYRINVFRQRGHTSVAARRVSRDIPSFEELHLPASLAEISMIHQGLILVTGVTGSGKSTAIAAMIEYINTNRECHVVSLEDPIEFLFEDKKAFINQREIGIDVPDFDSALKYLMRQDPDVVLIGEMRDRDTFSAAVHAAETGHLVFGTIHASGTAQVIPRILDLFAHEGRDLVRQTLTSNLRAVIGLKLLKSIRKDVPRIPSVEIMRVNPAVRKCIAEGRDDDILDVVRDARAEGMIDFNTSLRNLVEEEFIESEVAYSASPNPDQLRMELKGIRASAS